MSRGSLHLLKIHRRPDGIRVLEMVQAVVYNMKNVVNMTLQGLSPGACGDRGGPMIKSSGHSGKGRKFSTLSL